LVPVDTHVARSTKDCTRKTLGDRARFPPN